MLSFRERRTFSLVSYSAVEATNSTSSGRSIWNKSLNSKMMFGTRLRKVPCHLCGVAARIESRDGTYVIAADAADRRAPPGRPDRQAFDANSGSGRSTQYADNCLKLAGR
jgi:hypothetical protein